MSQSPVPSPAEPQADPSKFRALRRLPDGTIRCGGLELLDGEGMLWLDLTAPGPADLALIARRFGFHPLAIEDCAHLDQRPKIEEYGDHIFLVQHGFTEEARPSDLTMHELHAFLGKEYLVTVHDDRIKPVDEIFSRACKDKAACERGPDFLLYLLSDKLVDSHFEVIDDITGAIEALEDAILEGGSRAAIQEIFALKRALVQLRRTFSPTRDVVGLLARRGDPRVSERTALYFRDVYDHLVRVVESIEADRDLLGNALDAYLSAAANRTNDIVKQLTVLSVIFLPLTFITGFFGQNFTEIMPFGSPWLFRAMLASCVLVPTGMLLWFLRQKWL